MRRFGMIIRLASALSVPIAGCDSPQPLDPSVSADEIRAARQNGGTQVAPPTNPLAIAVSDNQIDFSWQDNSTNETNFEIYRLTRFPQYSASVLLASPAANAVSYSDQSVTLGVNYCYHVRAVTVARNKAVVVSDFAGESCAQTPPPVAPAAPSNARVAFYSASSFTVGWQDNSSSEANFQVYRSETGADGVFSLRQEVYDGRFFNDGTYPDWLTPFTEYCYKIRAFNRAGSATAFSDFSNVACHLAVPAPAQGTTARPASSVEIVVHWIAVGTTFRIEQSSDGGASWSVATTNMTAQRPFHASVQSEQTLCFRVINYLDTYEAEPSNVACTAAPAAPTSVAATTDEAGISAVTWVDNSNVEDGYVVWGWLEDFGSDGNGDYISYGYSHYPIATLPANSTSYRGPGLNFSVYAMKDGGYSTPGMP